MRMTTNLNAAVIYGPHRYVMKVEGYNTQPFKRDLTSLFNCVQPEVAADKKRLLRPSMNPEGMRLHAQSVQDNTQALVDLLHAQKDCVQDISVIAFHYALDVVAQSVLSSPFGLLQKEDDHWLTDHIVNANTHMYLQLAWPRMFAWLQPLLGRNSLTYGQFYDESKRFLDLSNRALANSNEQPPNAMYGLMKAEAGRSVSLQELKMEAFSFLRGGGDTVAITIATVLFYALKDKRIHARLQKEVRDAFVQAEDIAPGPRLDSCGFLFACVDEALRIAPPGPGVFWRQADRDMMIDNVRIPAGTEVGVSVFAIQHNKELFESPDTFIPERFLSTNEGKAQRSSGTKSGFMPFLRGFRSCPAQNLAYPMLLVPIARLFWEFDMEDMEEHRSKKNDGPPRTYFEQVDVFGSKVQGPWIRFHHKKHN